MNTAILIGNTGKEPEVKSFEWGKVATVSLATNKSIKDKDGEKKKLTQWHNLEFRGKLAEIVEKWVKKGDMIQVSGEIQYQEYEKDGQKKYITKIICQDMEMLGGQKSEEVKKPIPVNNEPEPLNDLPF
jgi:single-strand DNA-binding protein